jgi:hypothetical protein
MKPGSSIWVTSGSIFKASATQFNRCGTSMWNGITVYSGSIDFNHNTIKDADVGIDNSYGQQMTQFIQNTFDRCHIGLIAHNISPTRPFVGNNFVSNGNLITPYSGAIPTIGMYLENCTITERSGTYNRIRIGIEAWVNCVLMISTNKMSSGTHTAIFARLSNLRVFNTTIRDYPIGIWPESSDFRASENTITNIGTGLFIQNCINREIYTNDNTIDTFGVQGILQRNCSPTLTTYHEHNIITENVHPSIMSDFVFGMRIENDAQIREDNQMVIKDNIVSIDECDAPLFYGYYTYDIENVLFDGNSATFTPASSDSREGIYATNCADLELRGNSFTGGGDDTPSSIGIDFFNVSRGFLCCNTVTELNQGVYFSGAMNETRIRGTVFDGPFQDVGMNFTFAITGIAQEFPGNDWCGTAPDDARYIGSSQQARNDYFKISDDACPFYPDDNIDGPLNWFKPNQIGSEYDCAHNADCDAVPGINVNDYPNDSIILTKGYDDDHADGLDWQTRKTLLRELWKDSGFGYGITEVDSFRTANTTTVLGKLARITNTISKLYTLSSELNDSLIGISQILSVQTDSILLADSMFEDEGNDWEYWEEFRTNHLDTFMEAMTRYISVIEDHHDTALDTVSPLITYLNTFIPVTIMDTNDIFVTRFYLNRLLDSETPASSEDIDTLTSIADQCPLDGGDAVIRARAILNTLDTTYFNAGASCTNVTELRSSRKSTKNSKLDLNVYPNPNEGLFNLSITGLKESNSNSTITISDLNGKVVYLREFKEKIIPISINLSNGVYFVKFVSDSGDQIVKKIFVNN